MLSRQMDRAEVEKTQDRESKYILIRMLKNLTIGFSSHMIKNV